MVEQSVCGFETKDVLGSKEGWETFLPIVVTALDFAFCLWSGSKTQGDAVEVQGGAELGKCLGSVSEEERMIVDVESQWQAVSEEDAGKKIEVGEQVFAVVKAGARVEPGGVIEDIEENLFVALGG